MKRIQECNKLEKVWRYRWYGLLPFIWLACMYKAFKYGKKPGPVEGFWRTHEFYYSIRLGEIQMRKMNWYYTHEEVMERFNIKK